MYELQAGLQAKHFEQYLFYGSTVPRERNSGGDRGRMLSVQAQVCNVWPQQHGLLPDLRSQSPHYRGQRLPRQVQTLHRRQSCQRGLTLRRLPE